MALPAYCCCSSGVVGEIGEVCSALRLYPLDLHISGSLAKLSLFGVECHLEVERIDYVENVPPVDELVVDDADFRDLPRHLRCDARDLDANAPVPRPGRGAVVVPDDQRSEQGESEDE